ncbi:MAG TPA: DUF4837 family protein [Bacteroidota bacterium]
MVRSLFSFTAFGLLLFAACSDVKLPAKGEDSEILVFSDDTTWTELEATLKGIFQDTVQTPQPEPWYTLRRIAFSEWDQYGNHMNRIVVAPLDGDGDVAGFVRRSLDSTVQRLVREGHETVFNKYDSQARGQLLMFLSGPDLASLKSALETQAADLLYYFKRMSIRRELAAVESEKAYHKKDIEAALLKNYGWTMTIQHDYHISIDSASARFFWIRRANPADLERWVFVHWMEVRDATLLTEEFALTLRDELTQKFLRTSDDDTYVEIAPYHLQIENVDFLGRFAYETRGNWRFSDKSGGGPFVNYTFYDEPSRRIYVLDGSVFAPRVEKRELILQVDALLQTFRTEQEMTQGEEEKN